MPEINVSVTIITVCLNSERYISKCIESVVEQNYPFIEYIIIDGGSKDGTLDLIDKYHWKLSKVVSEPDNGIYNAMNKGLRLATGDIIFFLNSDDYLVDPMVISDVVSVFLDNPELDLVYGDQIRTDGVKTISINQPDRVGRRSLARRTIQHQTIFTRKHLFNDSNIFDENLRVVSDYKWILEVFLKRKCNYRHIPRVISVMSSTGLSGTTDYEPERRHVMKEYFSYLEIFMYRLLPLLLVHLVKSVR